MVVILEIGRIGPGVYEARSEFRTDGHRWLATSFLMAVWTGSVESPVSSINRRIPGQATPVWKSAWLLIACQTANAFTPISPAKPDANMSRCCV